MSGYVLLHRSIIGNPQFRGMADEYAAMWLIMKAAWDAHSERVGRHIVELQRGQVAHAIDYFATAWACSKSTAHARLRHFEKNGFIRTEARTGYTLVTICNYNEYQTSPNDARTLPRTVPERCPNGARTDKKQVNQGKEGKEDTAAAARVGDAASPRPTAVHAVGQRVLTLMGVENDPRWLGNSSRVEMWLLSGADPDSDIYPIVTRLMTARNGEPPRSLKYFDAAIADAVSARSRPLPASTASPPTPTHPRSASAAFDRLDADLASRRAP